MAQLMENRINNRISQKYEEARKMAVDEMIRLARVVLREHPRYDECVIAMGTIYFTLKDDISYNNTVDLYIERMNKSYGYEYVLTYQYFKPLADLLGEWNDVLKLTGEGVRFRATGELKYDW